MLQMERLQRILAYLSEQGLLSVDDAVAMLGASPATVRRDFNELAAQRLVERTRGGICRVSDGHAEMLPFAVREVRYSEEKAAVARAAAALLRPGDVIMVDGGTSTFHLAACMPDFVVRVITNSLRLGAALNNGALRAGTVELYLSGGHLYPQSGLLIGPQAAATLRQYHADWAFLSASGIDMEGVFNNDELVVEAERTIIRNSEKVVLLADHSKLGSRSMCRVCDIADVDVLVTDSHPVSGPFLYDLRAAGLQVIEVDVGKPSKPLTVPAEREAAHRQEFCAP